MVRQARWPSLSKIHRLIKNINWPVTGGTLILVIAIRVALFLVIAHQQKLPNFDLQTVIKPWMQWDAPEYIAVAREGYLSQDFTKERTEFRSRFPPLLPASMKLFHVIFDIRYLASGIVISIACLFFASLLLYRIAFFESKSPTAAWASVFFLNIFPGSYVANSVYAESMAIMFVAMFFYYVRVRPQQARASFAVSGLILSKTVGISLIPAHLYVYWTKYRTGKKLTAREGAYAALPLVVFVAHQLFITYYLTQPGYINSPDETSVRKASYFLYDQINSLINFAQRPQLMLRPDIMNYIGWRLIYFCLAVLVTIYGYFKVDKIYTLYCASHLILISSLTNLGLGVRFYWLMLPLFLILPRLRLKLVKVSYAVFSCVGLIYFSKVFCNGGFAF
jgi:hypothetical protein